MERRKQSPRTPVWPQEPAIKKQEILSFTAWWHRFLQLAREAEFTVTSHKVTYREYYADGDTPEEALRYEMDHA